MSSFTSFLSFVFVAQLVAWPTLAPQLVPSGESDHVHDDSQGQTSFLLIEIRV